MEESLEIVDPIKSLFSGAEFYDSRRATLFGIMVQTMARMPGKSLPELFPRRAHYHSVLNLLEQEECQHDSVLDFHSQPLQDKLRQTDKKVLIVHDSTLFDFSNRKTLKSQLGPIGNGRGTGWLSHQTIAVDPDTHQVHGLLNQILHVSPKKPKKTAKKQAQKGKTPAQNQRAQSRDNPDRLSLLWPRGVESLGPQSANFMHVADRGADTFEFLQMLCFGGHRFRIRSAYNRSLIMADNQEVEVCLHDYLRSQEAKWSWPEVIPAQDGYPARIALMHGLSMGVKIRPPHNKKGIYENEPIEVNVVRVWEEKDEDWKKTDPEPIEWILLTSEPVDTLEQVKECVKDYVGRWVCEEYHKVQKSGVKVESYQLQDAGKLGGLIAILSVVAVALLNMRLAARDETKKDEPAEKYVPKLWVELLCRYQFGKVREMTIEEFTVELARLGGYQKNPKKHPPGWITLWRGYLKLAKIIETNQRLNSA